MYLRFHAVLYFMVQHDLINLTSTLIMTQEYFEETISFSHRFIKYLS